MGKKNRKQNAATIDPPSVPNDEPTTDAAPSTFVPNDAGLDALAAEIGSVINADFEEQTANDPPVEGEEGPKLSHYARYKAAHLKYQASEKGKAARAKYMSSAKAKEARKVYQKRQSELNKEARRLLKESGVLAGIREGEGN